MIWTNCETDDDATASEELVSNAVTALRIEQIEHCMVKSSATP